MPKTKISEYSATANSNTDVASINIDEGCAPSGINNAIRAVMGHLKDFQQGTNGDPFNGPVNGTLGATTAATANVTTLTTSSTVTHNGGTANGVAYLNGSKVLTTGSALVFDGSNLGLGVTPSAWAANPKAMQLGTGGAIAGWTGAIPELDVSCNVYYASSNYRYITTGKATLHVQYDGAYTWYNAPSGTAGNAITLTQAMTLDSSGNLLVGKTSQSSASIGFEAGGSNGYGGFTRSPSTNTDTTCFVYSTGAGASRFYVGMGGTVYATSTTITGISDQRLKENIRDLDDGLDVVMALKPRKFDWKTGKGADIKNDRGFIAQEFETVLPDMIEEWKDPAPDGEEPYKAVNANLIPTLVKAIQELKAEIDSLKSQLNGA
jgi:hypothetical protein